jgi:uncharacterized protein
MPLNELERKALVTFRNKLGVELPDETIEVKLFGSRARGEGREDSDLDVLVIVSSEDWHLCDKVYGIVTDLLLETGICISPKTLSTKQYGKLLSEDAPFIKNVVRDAVSI